MMRKHILPGMIILFCFVILCCGRKGPILPPLIKSPYPVKNLSIKQAGDKIILEWVKPTSYMDGDPLPKTAQIEIWLQTMSQDSYQKDGRPKKKDFAKEAVLLDRIALEKSPPSRQEEMQGRYEFEWIRDDFSQGVFIFGLRVNDSRRKKSDFRLAVFTPRIVSLPPKDLKTALSKDLIKLQWSPPEKNIDGSIPARFKGYHVYRAESGQEPLKRTTVPLDRTEYADTEFQFGIEYTYWVRTVLSAEFDRIESSDSESVVVEPKDVYPPAPPSGLLAIPGTRVVALSWDPNSEEDLAGYKVWRKEGMDDFSLLTPVLIQDTTCNDSNIKQDREYTYAITALDQAGNESQRSREISVIIRSNSP